MKKNLPAVSHLSFLIQTLQDPEIASAYLNTALEDGDRRSFCLALKNVLDAQGGMTLFARKTKINRVSLHQMLSKKGNPGFDNILRLLQSAGVRFLVTANSSSKHPQKKAA